MSPADLIDPADKSRQKSCNACVRSKRRCDKRTPRCTRCAEKNFSCVYQNLPPSAGDHHQYDTSPAAVSGQDDPLHAMDLEEGGGMPPPPPFDFNTLDDSPSASSSYLDSGFPTLVVNEPNSNNAATATSTTTLDAASMPFDFNSVMDFLNADPAQGGEMQLWETPQPPVVPKTMAPELPQIEPPYGAMCTAEMEQMCIGFESWQVHEPGSRIGHLVASLKDTPLSFAQTKQTPFLHRHLYRHATPRPLMAAYTAISAYAGRTEANKDWAVRAICEAAAEIVKGAKDQTSSSASAAAMTGHEKLARAQALWLIQAVRCFDGDIALRAQAERDMGVLTRWLKELEGLRDNLDDAHVLDEPALRQRPPRSWELWVFNECVRRTVLMGQIFTSVYELLQGGEDEPDVAQWMIPHRWTFSRQLWDAQSSPAFFAAWREKPMFLVNSFFVQEAAKVARPTDVDDFARLFLVANFGVEETKHFMLEV